MYLMLDEEVYSNQEITDAASELLTTIVNNDNIPFSYRVAYLVHLHTFIGIYLKTLQETVEGFSEGDEQ